MGSMSLEFERYPSQTVRAFRDVPRTPLLPPQRMAHSQGFRHLAELLM